MEVYIYIYLLICVMYIYYIIVTNDIIYKFINYVVISTYSNLIIFTCHLTKHPWLTLVGNVLWIGWHSWTLMKLNIREIIFLWLNFYSEYKLIWIVIQTNQSFYLNLITNITSDFIFRILQYMDILYLQ